MEWERELVEERRTTTATTIATTDGRAVACTHAPAQPGMEYGVWEGVWVRALAGGSATLLLLQVQAVGWGGGWSGSLGQRVGRSGGHEVYEKGTDWERRVSPVSPAFFPWRPVAASRVCQWRPEDGRKGAGGGHFNQRQNVRGTGMACQAPFLAGEGSAWQGHEMSIRGGGRALMLWARHWHKPNGPRREQQRPKLRTTESASLPPSSNPPWLVSPPSRHGMYLVWSALAFGTCPAARSSAQFRVASDSALSRQRRRPCPRYEADPVVLPPPPLRESLAWNADGLALASFGMPTKHPVILLPSSTRGGGT